MDDGARRLAYDIVDSDVPFTDHHAHLCVVESTDPRCSLVEWYADADPGVGVLEELFAVIKDRQANPTDESYTARLLASGVGKVAQKVVEEAGETAIAAVEGNTTELPGEVADLLYHTLTLLAATNTSPKEVWEVLAKRRQGIGLHQS